MQELKFADFCNKFAGRSATVVGKGPTTFDYVKLAEMPDPVVFINDAVTLEKHLRPEQERFLFFLDEHQARHWVKTPVQAVLVMKEEHRKLDNRGPNRAIFYKPVLRQLPLLGRASLARQPMLALGCGTVSPVLHWLWYCGVKRVNFVGCDGINSREQVRQLTGGLDYDPRITLHTPGKCGWLNSTIRGCQDAMVELLGLEAVYHGTPVVPPPLPVLYISFGTPNYAPLLERLRKSAEALGLEIYTEIQNGTGDWVKNTCLKPSFVQKCMEQWPDRRLCWVDADAIFRKVPVGIHSLQENVDVAYAEFRGVIQSGTVYFGATAKAKALVKAWAAESRRRMGRAVDGQNFITVLRQQRVSAAVLPPSYCCIFDLTRQWQPGVEPVIEHMQASREVRKGMSISMRGD